MRDNVTATECRDSCKSTLVLKRKADILSMSYGISIYQLHSNILVDAC